MCGLAGIVGRIGPKNRAALRLMNGAMTHRGPDAEGYWESTPDAKGWGGMFGHRRLAILDLSPAGVQPMVDASSGDVVVLNGEIYNYVELRSQLTANGHQLQSNGDTAVMLRLLSEQGEAATARLRGMFAFAFWNTKERKLILARDPLGIKPLYLAYNRDPQGDWDVIFASEVRALLASGLLQAPRLNARAVASVVWNGFTIAPDTAVEGVESLLPGELRTIDAGGQESRREYWTANAAPSEPRISTEELASTLKECVRLHLASDVPLGVFLSGGIDSSAIANLAQKTSGQQVHTFTLAFREAELNEATFARQIANAIGTEHREIVLTEADFIGNLERALDSLDQPSFDGLNSYYMSKAVRDAGFTVALVGTGGDELFGGYTSFRDLPRMLGWSRRSKWLPMSLRLRAAQQFARWKQQSGALFPPQTRWSKLPDMVSREVDMLGLYQLAYALFLPRTQNELLGDAARSANVVDGIPDAFRRRLVQEIDGRSPLSAISVLEHRLFLGERLLRDTDAASMAASIETRLPLADQVLFKAADRLADANRYDPVRSKALLRRVGLVGLDPALFDRPKSGFELPYDRWLRSALGNRIDSVLRDEQLVSQAGLNPKTVERLWKAFQAGAPGLYWTRIWALYVLIRWCARFDLRI